MKFLTVSILLLFSSLNVFAQENPVKWTTKAEKINATEYNLIIDAEIQAGWNIYSQFLASDDGPVRTTFSFNKEGYELIGKTEESGNRKEGFDEMFGMNVIKFSKHVTYTQKIKITTETKTVKTSVNFMTCNDEVCLPPRDVSLDIKVQ